MTRQSTDPAIRGDNMMCILEDRGWKIGNILGRLA